MRGGRSHSTSRRFRGVGLSVLCLSFAPLAPAATLTPIADTHARAGGSANTNYASANPLIVRTNATAANNYDGYLKFDLSTVNNIVSARISLLTALSAAGTVTTTVYAVSNTTWGETTLTWNNRPPLGTALGTITSSGTTYTRRSLDITNYIRAEKAAGRNLVTLGLHNTANTTQQVNVRPREVAVASRPQLIVVENVAPTTSITAPTNGTSVSAPANITINANATDTDGTIANVQFLSGSTVLDTDTAAPYSYTWTNVPAGTYTLTTRATDNFGTVTPSAPITVTVTNAPPTATLTTPINNAIFTAPATITLSADATDTDGTITQVEFFNGGTSLSTDTTAPYTFDWTNVTAGTYSITARATDNTGAITTSAPINLTVNSLPIHYSYDELGRLIRVLDGAGRSAIYEYDATGNRIRVDTNDIANTAPTITSITPDYIRLNTPRNVTITGTNLQAATINTGDPAITAKIVGAQPNQITVRFAAANNATTGPRTIAIGNTAGSATTGITVRSALTVASVPAFIAVPPDTTARQLTLRLSDSSPEAVALTFNVLNPAVATVFPTSLVLNPGQTEAQVTVAGRQTGVGFLNIQSSMLPQPAKLGIYVSNDAFERSASLGVWFPPNAFAEPSILSSADLGVFIQATPPYNNVNSMVAADLGVFVQQSTAQNINSLVGTDVGVFLPQNVAQTINNLTSSLLGVVSGPSEVTSLNPSSANVDTVFTLTINGTNLFDASAVVAEPADGIVFTSAPTVTSDGLRLTIGVSIDPAAALGVRTLRVVTPRGTTSSTQTTGNSFTINSP